MAKTKKVGSAGRYGVRYGRKIRQRLLKVEKVRKQKYKCPNCQKLTIERVSAGIWKCKNCGYKFAGKAYKPM